MAAKPSAVPTWNTDGTNRSTPTAGQIATGIELGEAANSSRMNYLLNLLGQWMSYLNDGALTGAHTFGSTVGITGNTTVGGTLGVTGAATVGSLVVTAGATVGTTLGVTGNTTVGGTLGITGATTAAAITASGLITANAGVTAGANQHVTVSGTGRFKHGDMQIVIPSAMFTTDIDDAAGDTPSYEIGYENSGGAENTFGHLKSNISGGRAIAPIYLPVGARIKSIVLSLFADASHDRTFTIGKTETATDGVIEVGQTVDTGTGVRTISISGLSADNTMVSTHDFWIEIYGIYANDYVKSALVTYDFP